MPRQKKRRKLTVQEILEKTLQVQNNRAVGYCRVSTRDQVEGVSLEYQQQQIEKYCVYKNYDLVEMYVEKGESGAKEDRTQLKRLLQDAEEGKFDVVVIYTPDRFSRSVRIAMETMYKLEDMGIGIIILNPELDTRTPVGKMMFNILSYFAEMDREQIKKKLIVGKKDKLEKGYYISKKPYGYEVVEGELIEIPEEVEVIKQIFHWKAYDKLSLRKIASKLNEQGIPSPSGRKWSSTSVNNILKNKLYCGKYTYKVTHDKEKNIYEIVEVPLDIDPIVPPQVWGRANSNNKERELV